jgi:hypothetical protein
MEAYQSCEFYPLYGADKWQHWLKTNIKDSV